MQPTTYWHKTSYWIACGGGLGLLPYAPGTFGSVLAVALYYLTYDWSLWACVVAWFILLSVAFVSIKACLPQMESDDPRSIVIDEVVGALCAFVWLPAGWYWMVFAFVAFRVFDIVKPWPVSWADKNIKSATGVLLDDILAGVYAFITVQLVYQVVNEFVK